VAIFRLRPANFQKKYPDLEKWPAEFPKFPNAPPDFR
jgi:hypothetical protein